MGAGGQARRRDGRVGTIPSRRRRATSPDRQTQIRRNRQHATARGDSARGGPWAEWILEMKEGTTASRTLRDCLSSGDQAVTTLCLALPWTGPAFGSVSRPGASNSVLATYLSM